MKLLKQSSGIILIFLAYLSCTSFRQSDNLEIDFLNPPDSVRPWVYWYWYSDNISKDGIIKDLIAMSEIGIGTAIIGNVSYGGVKGDVRALSEEWWDLFKFAIKEAGKNNIDIGLFNCPGWSQSGGPWIKQDQTMRYLKSSEYKVSGPSRIRKLLKVQDSIYQNVIVLAYPEPKYDGMSLINSISSITGSYHSRNLDNIIDQNTETVFYFPQTAIDKDRFVIELKTKEKLNVRSLSLYPASVNFKVTCEFQVLNENKKYITIKKFNMYRAFEEIKVGPMYDAPTTLSFSEVKSDQFRFIFSNFAFHPFKGRYTALPGIKEIEISQAPKLERYIEKQLGKMFWMPLPQWDDYLWEQPINTNDCDYIIDTSKIMDISNKLMDNDLIEWDVPDGQWIIQRILMVPTGAKNAPVTKEAEGYEVDKMQRELAEYHFNSFVGKLIREMPKEERTALKYLVIDSYEQGSQNWTDDMRQRFIETYDYDPYKWLPVLSGRIVNNADQSERFLWDLRRIIADGISFDYAGGLRKIANENGLKLWMENYGHWGFPGEFLQYGGQSDIVAGEFWVNGELGSIEQRAASSAAHIYGKKIVCVESFTSGPPNFIYHPWALKKRGDWSFSEGMNQTVLHVYIHQPYEDKIPGINAPFGCAFNRHNTWFYKADSWIQYQKRSNFMLQQGNYVADIAYFVGEDVPKMTGIQEPELPNGYSFDYINADVILNRVQVKNGKWILPDGMSYEIIVLPKLETMRPQLLEKISDLVYEGGKIYGPKPNRSPSLANYPQSDSLVISLSNKLWQSCDGYSVTDVSYGKGKVFYGDDLGTVMGKLSLVPDISGIDQKDILWIHRHLDDRDIYFITNQSDKKQFINPIFRIKNKFPELWDAVDGTIIQTPLFKTTSTGTSVSIELNPYESTFVLFKSEGENRKKIMMLESQGIESIFYNNPSKNDEITIKINKNGKYNFIVDEKINKEIEINHIPEPIRLDHSWRVSFEEGKDIDNDIDMDSLISITEIENEAIRYYSGTVTYKNEVNLSEDFIKNSNEIRLFLESVGFLAEVIVNDNYIGNFWHPPFEIDISKSVKTGVNTIVVKVTNTWRNRLIGHAKYPNGFNNKGSEFKPWLSYDLGIDKNEEPVKSGLTGDVFIKSYVYVTF